MTTQPNGENDLLDHIGRLEAEIDSWRGCASRLEIERDEALARVAELTRERDLWKGNWERAQQANTRLLGSLHEQVVDGRKRLVGEWQLVEPSDEAGRPPTQEAPPAPASMGVATAYLASPCVCGHVMNWHSIGLGCGMTECGCTAWSPPPKAVAGVFRKGNPGAALEAPGNGATPGPDHPVGSPEGHFRSAPQRDQLPDQSTAGAAQEVGEPPAPRVRHKGDPEPEDRPTVRDCHGDVWRWIPGGYWEAEGTTPFAWSTVAKKWGPLTEVVSGVPQGGVQ